MANAFTALGLMSGTSMDGIDIALIETDGERIFRHGPARTVPYPAAFRERLSHGLSEALTIRAAGDRPGSLADLERELTLRHAEVVNAYCRDFGLSPAAVDVVGFHGQTVLHRPHQRLTVQLGDGALLAAATGIPVVNDFRSADVLAGGQGAPLAPVYHRALAATAGPEAPLAFLNLGGVGNVTYIGVDGDLIAFDTGPGNALIDDWLLRHTGTACDVDGREASQGIVREDILAILLDNPYFSRPAPKSLDRNDFSSDAIEGLSLADGAATLTAFTAASVVRALDHLPAAPRRWIICGGGRHNPAMMRALAERLTGEVLAAEALAIDGDSIEAEAFAFMAVRTMRGLPISFPGTTGAPEPMSGGVLHRLADQPRAAGAAE
jgi:anhydro-N-acetylmuramic acid kinase